MKYYFLRLICYLAFILTCVHRPPENTENNKSDDYNYTLDLSLEKVMECLNKPSDKKCDMMIYLYALRANIEDQWHYPEEAIKKNLQGEVSLEFIVLKSGIVRNIKVRKSSGHQVLDDHIKSTIEMTSPVNPLPPSFDKDKITVAVNFKYVIE